MKKFFYSLIFLLSASMVHAQNPSFSPAIFTAQDEITLTIDVTGTGMAGQSDAYIWMWSPSGDSPLNTSWTNSPNEAKMTLVSPNKWKFTWTPTVLWGRTPGELVSFNFLVKTKNGSNQTGNYEGFAYDPLVFTPTKLRVFPAKASNKDIITVNFDRTLGASPDEQRMTPTTATITAYDEAGTEVGTAITVNARLLQTNIWAATFDAKTRFVPAAGHTLKKIKYHFNGTVLNTSGATVSTSTSDFEYEFAILH